MVSIVLLALLSHLYFTIIPQSIDITEYTETVKEQFQKKTNHDLDINLTKAYTTWDLCYKIQAKNLKITSPNKLLVASGSKATLKIFLPALFFKHISLKEIKIDDFNSNIIRDSNGKLNIADLIPKDNDNKGYKVVLEDSNIELSNYFILIYDQFMENKQNFKLSGQKFSLFNFNPNKKIRLKAKGSILTNLEKSTYDIEFKSKLPIKSLKFKEIKNIEAKGSIFNFKPASYFSYIKPIAPEIKEITGKIDLIFKTSIYKGITTRSVFNINGNVDGVTVIKEKKGKVLDLSKCTNILAKGSYNDNSVNFDELNIKGERFNSLLEGSIAGLTAKIKRLNLKVKIAKSRAEDLISFIPTELKIKKDVINKAKKNNLKANIEADISIKGMHKDPRISGYATIDDLSFIDEKPSDPKAHGRIDFYGNVLNINAFVPLSETEHIRVTGPILPFVLKKINLKIESNEVNLAASLKKLLTIKDIIGFKLGPLPDMNIDGSGKISLLVSNTTKDPFLSGEFTCKNGYVKHKELSKPARNVEGSLVFEGRKFRFKDFIGFVEGHKVLVNGYTTTTNYTDVLLKIPSADFKTAKSLIRHSEMLKEVSSATELIDSINGKGEAELRLIGNSDNIKTIGFVNTKFANVSLVGYAKPITGVNGTIKIDKENIYFNNVKGHIIDSIVKLDGSIKNKEADIILSSNKLSLEPALKLINSSPALFQAKDALGDIQNITGYANAKITLKGSTDKKDIFDKVYINTDNATLYHKNLSAPVKSIKGDFVASLNDFTIKSSTGLIYNAKATAIGSISGFQYKDKSKVKPDVFINVEDFNLKNFDLLKTSAFLSNQQETMNILKMYSNMQGTVNAGIKVLPDGTSVTTLDFNNAKAIYKPTQMPIKLAKGRITTNTKDIYFKDLNTTLSVTPLLLNGSIKDISTNTIFDLQVNSIINSNDVDKYINTSIKSPIKVKSTVPIKLELSGNINNWKLNAKTDLTPSSNIMFKGAVIGDGYRTVNINAHGNDNKIVIDNLNLQKTDEGSPITMLQAKGTISELRDIIPTLENFTIKAPLPVSVKLLNPIFNTSQPVLTSGTMSGLATIQGNTTTPIVEGKITFKDISLPNKATIIKSAALDFTPAGIYINNTDINIAGSNVYMEAIIDNVLEPPLLAKYVKVSSPSLNIDKIVEALKNIEEPNNTDEQGNVYKTTRQTLPLVVIRDGLINADEMIINNLITDSLSAKVNLTPDWLLTIPSFSLYTTGGNIKGNILYNLNSSDLSLNMQTKDINANAIATTLFNMSNEVYGILNGNVQITTKGTTTEELLSNSKGLATFKVNNGRMVRLGSVEYLLKAINVVQGGITGFNVNNVLDLLVPHKTGYFKTLEGTLHIKNGIVSTDNTSTKGDNLSLFISGDFDTQTNYSDVVIMGQLSKKVSGLLGPIGSVSIGSVIDSIPVVNKNQKPQKNLLDKIPGLKKVPNVGIEDKANKCRPFITRIEGDLYDPKSLKSFKWLD